jgi:hypothetical protein
MSHWSGRSSPDCRFHPAIRQRIQVLTLSGLPHESGAMAVQHTLDGLGSHAESFGNLDRRIAQVLQYDNAGPAGLVGTGTVWANDAL